MDCTETSNWKGRANLNIDYSKFFFHFFHYVDFSIDVMKTLVVLKNVATCILKQFACSY